ncbi:MAG: aldose 1-epimerase family protein [Nocardioides sp.]|uniref:aldose 1-epimerase family protein n=1 Tax=Nocardioides sp. TaxID=35761 RepID=UPI0039E66B9C
MVAPTGEQYDIAAAGYRAVVTEAGATLRVLEHDGHRLLDGFEVTERPSGGRGQLLAPWVNRIRDGRYVFEGETFQLALSEPGRHNASHGLVRNAAWTVEEHTEQSVTLLCKVMAQTGYPWSLDLRVSYDLSADGLTVTHWVANLADEPAPYAVGAHPYLTIDNTQIDELELVLPAATRLLADPDRKLPTGTESVDGTDYDFRLTRPVGVTVFDHAFTDLVRDSHGQATTELRDPRSGRGVALWVDEAHRWLQVYSGEETPATARRSLAVEPMTAPPDAFNSHTDLVVLAPAGAPGDEHVCSWGIRALETN